LGDFHEPDRYEIICDVRYVFAVLICAAGILAVVGTARSTPSTALTCPRVGPHQGGTSGDWEVVFGRRVDMTAANTLRARVHRKGFGCARIEREAGIYEVCINGLTRLSAAERIMRRAHRAHL